MRALDDRTITMLGRLILERRDELEEAWRGFFGDAN
jgi:hypothetical protein